MQGVKYDTEKLRFDLIPKGTIKEIVKVLTFGSKKYADDNWQVVPGKRKRYYAALMRHIDAWWTGEINDPETKLSHLAHAGCCILFLLWVEKRGVK